MARETQLIAHEDFEKLRAFLAKPARPRGTFTIHELQGFLFTVACSPEIVMPSDWMPLISNDREMNYADIDEANAMLGRITALYNHINERVLRASRRLPLDCAFRTDILANLEPDAPISQWSRGFTIGQDWLSEVWDACLPEDYDEEFGLLLITLSFFGSRTLAESYIDEMIADEPPASAEALARIAKTMRRGFPSALARYAKLGRSLA